MTPEKKIIELVEEVQMNVEVVLTLTKSLIVYITKCEDQGYKVMPATVKMYATRIVEELCAAKEQDDA